MAHVRLPSPRLSLPWPWAVVHALWLAPTMLVGHLAGLLVSGGRRPTRVTGPAAFAWLYEIPPGRGLDWVGAVTLGHVILHRPRFFDRGSSPSDEPAARLLGPMILAHELAHTRQHDLLGPLYLPLHILAQTLSALLSIGHGTVHSRVHDHNPLEQTFICLGASAYGPLAAGARLPAGTAAPITAEAMLAAFGLAHSEG